MPLQTPTRAQGCAILLLMALATSVPGQVATNRAFAARAEQAFLQAQKQFAAQPGNVAIAWQLGRASFDWALAQTGIDACRHSLVRDPKSAPAHYYLAMNFGQLADAEAPSIAAYKLVKEIEREFKTATEMDEKLDFAGPPRCLGLLYRDAPGWPISIGSKRKAREFLDRAAALAPDYPENQLNLAESHLRWHQLAEAEKALKKLDALWPFARTNLVGEIWGQSWDDWTARRAAAKAEFQKNSKHAP